MKNSPIICFTPDRVYFNVAVTAASRLRSFGLPAHIAVAIVCSEGDIDPATPMPEGVMILRCEPMVCGEEAALPLGRHITPAAYRRLALPHILPDVFSRILYLDCDTLAVRPGIETILALDLGEKAFAAAVDMIFLKDLEEGPLTATFRAYRQRLGLALHEPYFNSGVLLIDRACWLQQELTQAAIAFATAHPALCAFHDQSALNAVARGKWAALSPRLNFMGDFLLLDLLRDIDPILLHFVNHPKPWQPEWRGPDWMRGLYTDAEAFLPAGATELSQGFAPFRARLLAWLAMQDFIDGNPLYSISTFR